MNTRRTAVEVMINTVDITRDISGDLLNFSYNDKAAEEADDISLSIQNRDGRWMKTWMPTEGDSLRAKISTALPAGKLDCGSYVIDEISFSGWPNIVDIKALAMPMGADFSDVPKNRTWNEAKLSGIAASIAADDQIELDYRAAYDPTLDFTSQAKKSDKAFLHDLCQKYGLTMKLYSSRIVIYDIAECEQGKAVLTIRPADLKRFSCKSSIANTGYSACTVKYTTRDGGTLEYTHSIKGKTEKVYRHTTTVGSLAEAQRVAQSMLREKNRDETTFSATMPGDVRMVSAICIRISGFGKFDGKYFVDGAAHSIGDGYETSFDAHKVVEND